MRSSHPYAFLVLTGRVWRRVPAKRLLTPDRQWMWGHLQGGAVLSLRFLSTCIIRYAVFFGPSLYLFHGSHWAWDRKAYGSVSACFLNLAICPLVPITLLLPDLNAEQIILIHMAEYYLQCCLQGNLKHRLVQTVGSQWSTYPLVRVIPQHQKAVLRGLQEQFFSSIF